jgi:hypothetical protein
MKGAVRGKVLGGEGKDVGRGVGSVVRLLTVGRSGRDAGASAAKAATGAALRLPGILVGWGNPAHAGIALAMAGAMPVHGALEAVGCARPMPASPQGGIP